MGDFYIHIRDSQIYTTYTIVYFILFSHIEWAKKIVIMPNSFGPFMGKLEKRIVKKVLNKCELIYARENISREYLQNLLGREIYLSPDLGFYISPSEGEVYENAFQIPKTKKQLLLQCVHIGFQSTLMARKDIKIYK